MGYWPSVQGNQQASDLVSGGGADTLTDESVQEGTNYLVETTAKTPAANRGSLAAEAGGIAAKLVFTNENGEQVELDPEFLSGRGGLDFATQLNARMMCSGGAIMDWATGQMTFYPGNLFPDASNTGILGESGGSRYYAAIRSFLAAIGNTNGCAVNIRQAQTTVTESASEATLTATGLIPAGAIVLAVNTYVLVLDDGGGGASTYDVGDGSDGNNWGSAIDALTVGSTSGHADYTADPAGTWTAAARDVILDADGANTFSGGFSCRIVVHYIDTTAPTS